jgi:hypothetical protein
MTFLTMPTFPPPRETFWRMMNLLVTQQTCTHGVQECFENFLCNTWFILSLYIFIHRLEKGFLIEYSRDSKTKKKIVAPKRKIHHPLRRDLNCTCCCCLLSKIMSCSEFQSNENQVNNVAYHFEMVVGFWGGRCSWPIASWAWLSKLFTSR